MKAVRYLLETHTSQLRWKEGRTVYRVQCRRQNKVFRWRSASNAQKAYAAQWCLFSRYFLSSAFHLFSLQIHSPLLSLKLKCLNDTFFKRIMRTACIREDGNKFQEPVPSTVRDWEEREVVRVQEAWTRERWEEAFSLFSDDGRQLVMWKNERQREGKKVVEAAKETYACCDTAQVHTQELSA